MMNEQLKRAYGLKSRAHAAQGSDPDHAVALFRQSIDAFRAAGDERAELEATHWLMQTLNCFAGRYREALDVGVRAVVRAKGPQYADFTTRICLHEDLISAYIGVDPEGYEPEIRDLLAWMQGEISPGLQCAYCLRYRSFDLELWLERFEAARAVALESLGRARGGWMGDWHRAGYLGELCQVACLSGLGAEEMAEWAREYEELSRKASRVANYNAAAMFRGAGYLVRGDQEQARAHARRARAGFKRNGNGFENYFVAARYFAQLSDDWKTVAALCDAELEILATKSAPVRTARVHRWKCEALFQIGKLDAPTLQSARAIAGGLRAPHAELRRLDALGRA